MGQRNGPGRSILDRADDITNDQQTVDRIKKLAAQTGYHPTYIAAWVDVEKGQTPEERANRAAQMIRVAGDAFEQYSGNSQRQYETQQQMKNSRKNRKHQTDERLAGQEYKTGERLAGQEYQTKEREETHKGNRKNIKFQDKRRRKSDAIERQGRQEDQAAKNKFDLKRDAIQHDDRLEEIDAQKGTGPTAFKRFTENKDELLAADPSGARIDFMFRQERELNPNASDEAIREKLKQEMKSYYGNFFHDPESPIAASGNVPPGLVAEMSKVLGPKPTFEEFCDYVGLDENDARTAKWFTEITGLAPNHDHWLPDWMTGG